MTKRVVASKVTGHPVTEDGRYFAVRRRLWRMANPSVSEEETAALTRQLMDARRHLRCGALRAGRAQARADIDAAKTALGELGPRWWTDEAPDYNRKLAKNTPYAAWHQRAVTQSLASPKERDVIPTPSA